MKLVNHAAYGKIQKDPPAWLPLLDHMTDVAYCFERLCRCQFTRRALEKAAERSLAEQDIARLSVVAFLYDRGKANSGFQVRRWHHKERPSYWPDPTGHGRETILLFSDSSFAHLSDALPLEQMYEWGEEALDHLLTASISHHGQPIVDDPSTLSVSLSPANWKPV
ncbi:MAG: HD domain-containing protein [Sedimenticola sp.]